MDFERRKGEEAGMSRDFLSSRHCDNKISCNAPPGRVSLVAEIGGTLESGNGFASENMIQAVLERQLNEKPQSAVVGSVDLVSVYKRLRPTSHAG
jgi:hypothetical protein